MFSLALLAGNAAAGTVTVNFTTLPGNTAGGYYVGNTGATVNGVPTPLMCDDFSTETSVPSGPFQYNVTTLANLATAKFTGLANYETAAVLLWEFENSGQQDAGAYNFALWDIFDPGAGAYGDSAALLAGARSTVAAGGIPQAYSALLIYTAIPVGSNQEFLGEDSPTPVPEPGSMLLMGGGLLLLGTSRWLRGR
jgi:hypothetical protein